MFSKVLVANRGEIAVRVQQTLHVMGISTVAVYSDPDANAPHVRMANEAYPLFGVTAEETYLNMDRLLDVARTSGSQAIHPGYGFLSENPAFARACKEAGIVFIGPTPENMEDLGDKVNSKKIASQAGVPVIESSPIYDGDSADIRRFIKDTGFPLMVKAAAGGGGRGLRLVTDAGQLAQVLEAASREARAAFGDGRVFLERYMQRPRHVEIQVMADSHGNVVHLLERECSLQRRHQKIIEETPSPALTPELRVRMGEAAVRLAQKAGYVNAGTVEFLLDGDGNFYFLEMNTRLQVEHPITEEVTGLDLVELQTRIAAGEQLPIHQEDVLPKGHAIECRIYAEDPYNDFIPSTGELKRWVPPYGPKIRLDSGFIQGQEVHPFYDSMLAKLVVWGPDRRTSLRRMEQALRRFIAVGVVTNIPFMRNVIAHPLFQQGTYNTAFLDEHPEVLEPTVADELLDVANALAAQAYSDKPPAKSLDGHGYSRRDSASPWHQAGHWRLS